MPTVAGRTATRQVNVGPVIKGQRVDGRAFQRHQAKLAIEYRDYYQALGEFPKDPKQYSTRVDRRPVPDNKGEERNVKVDGRIDYFQFEATSENYKKAMVEFIRLLMRKVPYARKQPSDARSSVPFRRRNYIDSFVLLKNNRLVQTSGPGFKERATRWIERFGDDLKDGDTLAVTNIQPYARRVEQGANWKPGQGWARGFPRGVFKRTRAEALRSKKTKGLYISQLEWTPLPGQINETEYSSQGAVTYAEGRHVKVGKRTKVFKYSGRIMRKHRVYPTLFFGPPRTSSAYGAKQTRPYWTQRKNVYRRMEGGTIASQIQRAGGILL